MKRLIAMCLFILPSVVFGADVSPVTKDEIAHLLSYVERSGCEFNRNGRWYDAKHAVEHIELKYHYLLNRDLISNTESFIDRAASESSMSGKRYLVRCNGAAPQESATWFRTELAQYRQTALRSNDRPR